MSDFETHPIGTGKRIEQLRAVVEAAKTQQAILSTKRLWSDIQGLPCVVDLGDKLVALEKTRVRTQSVTTHVSA